MACLNMVRFHSHAAADRPMQVDRGCSGLHKRLIAGLVPVALATGCTAYQPAPRPLADIAATYTARTLSWAEVVQTCKQLATAATCDPTRPDRLLLFAAMLDNNPEIAAARAHLRTAEAAAVAARTPPAATLTLSTEYARDPAASSPWLLGAALDIPLDTGGRRSARLAAADLPVALARLDLAETIWTKRMELVRALDGLGIARQLAALSGDLVAVQERRLQAMELRVTAGEDSRAEVERVRLDLVDARRREASALAAREAQLVQFGQALGVPVANLPPIAMFDDADEVASGAFVVADDTRRQALLGRADLLRAMIAYDQAEVGLRTEIAAQFPAISIGPGFTWERGLVKLPLNLGLVLPPLDLNRRNIEAAEARRSEAGRALEAAFAAATGSVEAAMSELAAKTRARDQVRALDLPIAQRLAAQADRELAAGAIDRTEWAAAHSGVLIARLSDLDALADVLAANAALEDSLRRPLSGPETLIEGLAQ